MNRDDIIPIVFRNLDELRHRVVKILVAFLACFAFFMFFSVQPVTLLGNTFTFVYPNIYHNISAQILSLIEAHVLTAHTQLLILKPADGLTADAYVAIFLSLIVSMPVIVYEISMFLGPALKKSEKVLLRTILVPASLLFLAGSMVGLFWIAPPLFQIFNSFDIGLGATPTMSLMNFVSFLVIYVLSFGLSFEVPVFMYGLTRAGMVMSDTWAKNWRYAVVGSLFFGLIFSPGVTGFTEVLMASPMIVLYFGGVYFSRRYERKVAAANSNTVSEPL